MRLQIAAVFQNGHAMAIRLRKSHRTAGEFTPGDRVVLALPTKPGSQDRHQMQSLVERLRTLGTYADIGDAVGWQRQVRRGQLRTTEDRGDRP